jgi:hypothetical protein
MLNKIIDSQKVRAQKVVVMSQSLGNSFITHRSEDRLEIKMVKKSLRKRDEEIRRRDDAMRQRNKFYAQAFAQQ